MQKSNKAIIIMVVVLLGLNISVFYWYSQTHPSKNHQFDRWISGPRSRYEQVLEFLSETPDDFNYQFSRFDPNNFFEEYLSHRSAYRNVEMSYTLTYTDFCNITIIQNETTLEVVTISKLIELSPFWINSSYSELYDAYVNRDNGTFPVISLENVLFINIICSVSYWNHLTPYEHDGIFSQLIFQALVNSQLEPILCPMEVESLLPV